MPSRTPLNIVVFVSDEHAARFTGCYGHDTVETPNIDRIADQGIQCDRAYCQSPICVPSRLSFFTGRYPHEIGAWDQGCGLPNGVSTWGDQLDAYETVLCGRAHTIGDGCRDLGGFDRRLVDDPERWKNHLEPRAPPRTVGGPHRRGSRSHVTECGVDEDHWHLAYDRTVARMAADFVTERAPGESPWMLYVGIMNPHFPLLAPHRLLSRYDQDELDLPPTRDEPLEEQHPFVQDIRTWFRNDTPLDEEVERRALASYYALITFVDELVGIVYGAVEDSGQAEDTVFCYTSDHGEMAGHHGQWQKHCMYDPATRVPLVLSGPGVPDRSVQASTGLIDLAPTWLDVAGQKPGEELAGESLLDVAESTAEEDSIEASGDAIASDDSKDDPERGGLAGRPVLSEYHAMGSTAAAFMLAQGKYKYVQYVDHGPQLFDVSEDPDERRNLAADPEYSAVCDHFESELRSMLDPEAIDAEAKADQRRRREMATD